VRPAAPDARVTAASDPGKGSLVVELDHPKTGRAHSGTGAGTSRQGTPGRARTSVARPPVAEAPGHSSVARTGGRSPRSVSVAQAASSGTAVMPSARVGVAPADTPGRVPGGVPNEARAELPGAVG
jgi:hypothetical protein